MKTNKGVKATVKQVANRESIKVSDPEVRIDYAGRLEIQFISGDQRRHSTRVVITAEELACWWPEMISKLSKFDE